MLVHTGDGSKRTISTKKTHSRDKSLFLPLDTNDKTHSRAPEQSVLLDTPSSQHRKSNISADQLRRNHQDARTPGRTAPRFLHEIKVNQIIPSHDLVLIAPTPLSPPLLLRAAATKQQQQKAAAAATEKSCCKGGGGTSSSAMSDADGISGTYENTVSYTTPNTTTTTT